MRITVAHSPDSDDAFMFYGLASGAVDTDGIEVAQVLSDIETLNRAAFEGRYEVTAVSFHAFAYLDRSCFDGSGNHHAVALHPTGCDGTGTTEAVEGAMGVQSRHPRKAQ